VFLKRIVFVYFCVVPDWLQRDGIVMAGSWEPLLFRVRRDGSDGYTPTAEQRAAYLREHSPEMVARLKHRGVNFVMMHCYKGAGLKAERESMADAVEFARLCHQNGLRGSTCTAARSSGNCCLRRSHKLKTGWSAIRKATR